MTYRIRTVSELTGIPRNTLIAWERRYGVTQPSRGGNGYRAYSEADVAKLLRIKSAVSSGLSISEAAALVGGASQAPTDSPPQRGPSDQEAATHATVDHFIEEMNARLLSALVGYRREEAEGMLGRLAGIPYERRLTEVIFPVLHQVGDLWERGKVTMAQEHFASAVLRDHLSWMLLQVGQRGPAAPHAVTTTFPGEAHELAALGLGVKMGLAGYRVSHLGANLPPEELGEYCQSQLPDVALVSVICPVSHGDLVGYGQRLRALAPQSVRLVVGGAGVKPLAPIAVEGIDFVSHWEDLQVDAALLGR
jgi:DNA-binding transcriptional MerR regulator